VSNVRIVKDAAAWNDALANAETPDFYYTYEYHQICAAEDGSEPVMVVYEHGRDFAILPFLQRNVPCSSASDGVSVYGYCGPVSKVTNATDATAAMLNALKGLGIVSVFVRLHPLFELDPIARGLGEVVPLGTTVSVDLARPHDQQVAGYRGSTRREINKLRTQGVTCYWDRELVHLAEFVNIYHETMTRVGASSSYFFDARYFNRLVIADAFNVRLYVCSAGGRTICGGLFSFYGDIVQYHLSATDAAWYRMTPNKLMIETVRSAATELGMKVMHLGGGVGGRQDSLFRFKAGFSKSFHRACALQITVDPEAYALLCKRHNTARDNQYFPAYRAPAQERGTCG
jgi:hypothetical protein